MAPALPPEVLDLLSLGGRVRLSLSENGEARVLDVAVAPLPEGLFVLVPAASFVLDALERDPRSVLTAEDTGPSPWRLVTRGRAIPGRRVVSEPLRVQLAYWLPEGGTPGQMADLVAVRFVPEHLEYVRGAEKFYGAIPNSRVPEQLVAWWTLAVEGQWFWITSMIIVNFFAGIFLEENTTARFVLVGATMLPAFVMLCGLVLWNHGAVGQRWRESLEPEAAAWGVRRGWLGAVELRRGGVRVMAFGLAMLPVLVFVHPRLVPLALLSSGFVLLGPFYAVRQFFRHTDGDRAPAPAIDVIASPTAAQSGKAEDTRRGST